jgi:exopolysaccharide biosynthesis polyprenyl glycosylphosphotransferase
VSTVERAWRDLRSLVDDDRTLEIAARRRSGNVRRRGWLVRRALVLADVAGLFFAFLVAQNLFVEQAASGKSLGPETEWLLFLLTLPGWIVVAKLYRLYDRDEERADHSTVDDIVGVFHLVTVSAWLFYAGAWFTGAAAPHMPKLVTFWLLAIVLVCTCRAIARSICRRSVTYLQNTIIVGAGEIGQTIARKLTNHPEYGINLVGFVDHGAESRSDVLGSPEQLPGLIELFDVERVVIAFSDDAQRDTLELVPALRTLDVQIDFVPRLFELVGPNVGFHSIEGMPLLGLPPARLPRSSMLLKRAMDVILSAFGLLVLAPMFAAIAIAIKLESRGPVFFRQIRMGSDGTFRIWKFRTMVDDAEARKHQVAHLNQHLGANGDPRMFKIPCDPRITRVGRILRRYSLDELPQLINVISGEMSLVGPRPLILDEDKHVTDWARRRLDLKPGITGLWQALGRSEIPFGEMVELDYRYVTAWSLAFDLRLIAQTIATLARTERAL